MRSLKFILKQVRSSSLIEVIVAMLIITTVFTLASVIYLNVQKSGSFSRRLSAVIMMEELYASTLQTKAYINKQVDYEDVTVYQEVKPNAIDGLLLINLEVRDINGKLLAEQKHLVYAPAEN